MKKNRLNLFGHPNLQNYTYQPKLPDKAYALFALIVLSPKFRIKRYEAATFLWEDAETEQANANLRQLISRLKRALGPNQKLIKTNISELIGGSDLKNSDLCQFLSLTHGNIDLETSQNALQLYIGELLSGILINGTEYQNWLITERARLDNLFLSLAMNSLVEITRFGTAEPLAVEKIAERMVIISPDDSEVKYIISEAFKRSGNALMAERWSKQSISKKYFQENNTDFKNYEKRKSDIRVKPLNVQHSANDLEKLPRVKILPPQQYQSDKSAWIYRAFVEDIANCLTRYRTFSVLSTHSTFLLEDSGKKTLTDTIKSEYSLSSFLIPNGQRMAFRLYDDRTTKIIWASEFYINSDNIGQAFGTLTNQIAESLAGILELNIKNNSKNREDFEAYKHFLFGKKILNNCNLPALRKARRAFTKASSLANNWAECKARIAQTILLEWLILGGTDPYLLHRSKAEVKAALNIDSLDGTARWMSAVLALYQREADKSREEFIIAESLNPHSSDLLIQHADALSHFGEIEPAKTRFNRALYLNPIAPDRYWWVGAGIMFQCEKYSEAVSMCRKMQDEEPALRVLTASLALSGDKEDARFYAAKLKENYPQMSAQEITKLSPDTNMKVTKMFIEGLKLAGIN